MSEIMRNELGTSYPLRGFKYLILRLFVGESLQDLMKKLLLKLFHLKVYQRYIMK